MKKRITTFFAFSAAILLLSLTFIVCSNRPTIAEGNSPSSISINNTTSYDLTDLRLTFNGKQKKNVTLLKSHSVESVKIPSDIKYISHLTICGKTKDGKVFSNSFYGTISNKSCFTIYLDEYTNLHISSNLDE